MSNLSDLTIIIPSYNRQGYVIRQLKFWKNTEVKVLVLDGSENVCSKLSSYTSTNIKVLHIPKSIEKRLGLAGQIIETKYAAMISDDEFFLPSALSSVIEFLDKNLSYSACKGRAVGFNLDSENLILGKMAYEDLEGYDLNLESPSERMIDHMSPYVMASLWAVHRTEVLKICLDLISRNTKYSSAAAVEIQISLITAWYGKIKVLNELMWFRSYENENIWWSFGNVSTYKWLSKKKYKQEINQFIDTLSHSISCSQKDIRSALEGLIAYYEEVSRQRGILIRLASVFAIFIPVKAKLLIAAVIKRLIRNKQNSSITLFDCVTSMQNSGVIIDMEGVEAISSLVKQHNHVHTL